MAFNQHCIVVVFILFVLVVLYFFFGWQAHSEFIHPEHIGTSKETYVGSQSNKCVENYNEAMLQQLHLKKFYLAQIDTIDSGTKADLILFGTNFESFFQIQPSALFITLSQLNFTHISENEYTSNCKPKKKVEAKLDFSTNFTFIRSEDYYTSVEQAYKSNPNAKFMGHKVNETVWLEAMLASGCGYKSSKAAKEACRLPLPFHANFPSAAKQKKQMLAVTSNTDLLTVKQAFAAYYQFVECLIPLKQLLWVDDSKIEVFAAEHTTQNKKEKSIVSSAYWDNIISFLNISITDKVLNKLSAAGVPHYRYLNKNETNICYMGSER